MLSQDFSGRVFRADVLYSAWANRRLLDACARLNPEELERGLGVSHSNILATLQHICDAEKVWLDCLTTTGSGASWRLPPGPAPALSLNELWRRWPEFWEGYEKWLDRLADAASEMSVEVIVLLPEEMAPRLPRWKILRHVLDHSQFHRGQIVGMIRRLGHTPPAINRMDYWLAGALV